uniref:Large ribosomal subunit protein bL9 n=1 Tax=uncultured bacterium F25-01 TaxID=1191433 RepID=I3VIF3_9BACT|nr:LSU ribosomal protein L9p [uncultured bacterium F25-01]
MKVLLIKEVANVGQAGETKTVADGFARNFLLPRGLATLATAGALKQVDEERQVQQRKDTRAKTELSQLSSILGATSVTFKAKVGEQNRLFGSITAGDIAKAVGGKVGHPIDKRHIQLDEPIRHLGTYKVAIRVGPKASPSVTVVVEAESAS